VSPRALLLLALVSVLALAACGKRGAPMPPGPADQITYPRSYPAY
jgi:predicted small lipoprotein YifL